MHFDGRAQIKGQGAGKVLRLLSLFAGALVLTLSLAACSGTKFRKLAAIERGESYFRDGNYKKARIEFRTAAQLDPNDAHVQLLLGEVAEKEEEPLDAFIAYSTALSQDANLSAARAALGRLTLTLGRPNEALDLIAPGFKLNQKTGALILDASAGSLMAVRAAAHAQLGQDGIPDAQAAVRLAPDDEFASLTLASLLQRGGAGDRAIAVLESALGRDPTNGDLGAVLVDDYELNGQANLAQAQLLKLIKLNPRTLRFRYRLARFYLTHNQVDTAEKVLRQAVRELPDEVEVKLELIEFLTVQRGREAAVVETRALVANSPANDRLRLDLARSMADKGLLEEAESLLRAAVAHADSTSEEGLSARSELASVLLARGDQKAAAQLVADVLGASPRDGEALQTRGLLDLLRGDPAAAIADLRTVLLGNPKSLTALRNLARAYAESGTLSLAADTLTQAMEIDPRDPATQLALAQVRVADGHLPIAADLLHTLAVAQPLNMTVQETLFRATAGQQQWGEARAAASAIEKSRPDLPLGFYLEGLVDEAQAQFDEAKREYSRAVELPPTTPEPLAALMNLLMKLNQDSLALEVVDAAIQRDSKNAIAYSFKGDLLARQHNVPAAMQAYQQALTTDPKWAQGYRQLAATQLAVGQQAQAIQTLQQGIRSASDGLSLVGFLAQLYERLKRPDDAIAIYQWAFAQDPRRATIANNLAMLLVTYRKDAASMRQADALAERLASLQAAGFIDTRGWVKLKAGDAAAAVALLQDAVARAPNEPTVHYHLAMAQLARGDRARARNNLEQALQGGTDFVGAPEARALMRQLQQVPSAPAAAPSLLAPTNLLSGRPKPS